MHKFVTLFLTVALSGCTTINGVDTTKTKNGKDVVMTIATIVVVGAIAKELGKDNMKRQCTNNPAGFWQDRTTGKIYFCK